MSDTNNAEQPPIPENVESYGKHYSETNFWGKLQTIPRSSIRQVLEKALLLRELLLDRATPLWVRGTIIGALGYLILPFDLIPDLIPGAGFIDDLAAMGYVLASLDTLVTEDLRARALERMPASLIENEPEPTP